MKKRLLYLALALFGAPLLWGQSTVVCTTSSPGTVIGSCASGFSSPVTTDPVSATGVWTFDNAANTPVTFSDGATVKAGTGTGTLSVGGVLCKGAGAASASTSEEVLATCTIPANTLTAAGSMLRLSMNWTAAATANNKTISVRLGGIGGTVLWTILTTVNNQRLAPFTGPMQITWESSTSGVASGQLTAYTAAGGAAGTSSNYGKAFSGVNWAIAQDLVITKTTPTAASDLTLQTYVVEVVQ